MLLQIKNLKASIEGEEILKGINLEVDFGEIHAIMGPNGSGKSTLSKVLAGHPDYNVTQGEVLLQNESILELEPDERAKKGIFLGFQYPVEVPGVNNADFLRLAYNSKRVYEGKEELDPFDFDQFVKEKTKLLDLNNSIFLERSVNDGFSGGEKKRNEILQMAVLEPCLAILDEIDSGLDIDALRIVAAGVNRLMSQKRGLLLITHYQRLLEYIVPTHVHVMYKGQIVRSGGKELALELEKHGYDLVKTGANA
jgi:Fe-S cluster assembly ATP-binding protein